MNGIHDTDKGYGSSSLSNAETHESSTSPDTDDSSKGALFGYTLFALGLAAVAEADLEGACRGIATFTGVRRRFELHEGSRGGILINDYAHHPTEIRAVIRATRARFPGRRLLVAFQPHQHQRTLCLLPEFASALAEAEQSVVADIYGARESEEIKASVSARDLVEAVRAQGAHCEPGGAVGQLSSRVAQLRRADELVLVLGAGDIDGAVGDILAVL